MTALIIGVPDVARTTGSAVQRTQLDGRDYVITWQWNERLARWTMSIADQDGDPIASGVALVVDFPLLSLVTDERAPPGTIAVVDRQSPTIDPTLTSLGVRHVVCYWPEA